MKVIIILETTPPETTTDGRTEATQMDTEGLRIRDLITAILQGIPMRPSLAEERIQATGPEEAQTLVVSNPAVVADIRVKDRDRAVLLLLLIGITGAIRDRMEMPAAVQGEVVRIPEITTEVGRDTDLETAEAAAAVEGHSLRTRIRGRPEEAGPGTTERGTGEGLRSTAIGRLPATAPRQQPGSPTL